MNFHDISRSNVNANQLKIKENHRLTLLSQIPPIIHQGMDTKIEDQLNVYLGLLKQGKNYNSLLKNKKEFSNVEMLNNSIHNLDIDEYYSAVPQAIFNLKNEIAGQFDFYDGIARKQGDMTINRISSYTTSSINLEKDSEKGKQSLWDTTADPGNDTDRYSKISLGPTK